MTGILRHAILAALCLQASEIAVLEAAKQHVQLSDSYLPVAMQVIAHLTDQMAFEVKEEPGKPTTRPSTNRPSTTRPTTARPTTARPPKTKPTVKPLYVTSGYFQSLQPRTVGLPHGIPRDITTPFHRPGYYAPVSPPKPSERITGKEQHYPFPTVYQQYNAPGIPQQNQQVYVPPVPILQQSFIQNFPHHNNTQYHYQQAYHTPSYQQTHNQQQFYIPPDTLQPQNVPQSQQYPFTQSNQFNSTQNQYQYSTFNQNQQQYSQNQQQYSQNQQYGVMTFDFPQYNPIQPQNVRNEEPLLSAHHEEVKPLMEPTPDSPQLLPPHVDTDVDKISSRSKGFDEDELNEDNLQYLSQNVREMIRMANDPYDERLIDVWEGLRANPAEPGPKGKLSASNLRLLLLYDLLSREAKRQRLSDYGGYSPDVMRTLVESSSGGARAQLSMALSKMVERHDCAHEYANNRAKEMVAELAKDESKLSSEIRYLQPLVYKY